MLGMPFLVNSSRCSRRTALVLLSGSAKSLAGWPTARSGADNGDTNPIRLDYGHLPSQYVELTLPAGSAPAPVVVIVHGGFWSNGFGLELGRSLATGVPSICVHGRSDSVVPITQSERFVTAARGAGDSSELRAFDGGHFDLIAVGSPAGRCAYGR